MRWVLLLVVVGLAGCEPFVAIETYFCGPNRGCPPDQSCDDRTWICTDEGLTESFLCPEGSDAAEPDDTRDQALDFGDTFCGDVIVSERPGCLPDADDVDIYSFNHPVLCERNNTMEVTVSYPAAFVPADLRVVDSAGNDVGEPVDCTNANANNGRYSVCIDFELGVDRYFVEVSPLIGTDDCSGDCQFQQYILDIRLPP
ncbi:MAG: hypothetical protein KJO07_09420 [Deltaproteobacteria bacterium]|nr:hypothetical protein [Deltaproteobacteria bacterium]